MNVSKTFITLDKTNAGFLAKVSDKVLKGAKDAKKTHDVFYSEKTSIKNTSLSERVAEALTSEGPKVQHHAQDIFKEAFHSKTIDKDLLFVYAAFSRVIDEEAKGLKGNKLNVTSITPHKQEAAFKKSTSKEEKTSLLIVNKMQFLASLVHKAINTKESSTCPVSGKSVAHTVLKLKESTRLALLSLLANDIDKWSKSGLLPKKIAAYVFEDFRFLNQG